MNVKQKRRNIIEAGLLAVDELVKIAKEPILDSEEDVAADRLKNAAATKKLAIIDALEILDRITQEEADLKELEKSEQETKKFKGLAGNRKRTSI